MVESRRGVASSWPAPWQCVRGLACMQIMVMVEAMRQNSTGHDGKKAIRHQFPGARLTITVHAIRNHSFPTIEKRGTGCTGTWVFYRQLHWNLSCHRITYEPNPSNEGRVR